MEMDTTLKRNQYSSRRLRFGIAQESVGFNGYEPPTSTYFPGTVDYALGGNGLTDTSIDAMISLGLVKGPVKGMFHLGRYLNYLNNFNAVNPPGYLRMNQNFHPQDNTKVNLVIPPAK